MPQYEYCHLGGYSHLSETHRFTCLRLKIATGTMSKLNKGEEVALSVLLRICEYLDCDIGDVCSVVKPKKEDTV